MRITILSIDVAIVRLRNILITTSTNDCNPQPNDVIFCIGKAKGNPTQIRRWFVKI